MEDGAERLSDARFDKEVGADLPDFQIVEGKRVLHPQESQAFDR
jgi:hypothetical protein